MNKQTKTISSQDILDSGLNVFALQLLIESFTKMQSEITERLKIDLLYKGVHITMESNVPPPLKND